MTNTLRKLIAIIALVLVAAAQSSGVSSASSAQSSSGIWSSSITGSWKMISAAGYSTNISVSVSATTIRFSYCNQQSYNYRIGWGNSISINLGSTTQRMCKMISPPTQNQIRDALVAAASFSISGDTLTLKNRFGSIVATLSRERSTPFPQPPTTPPTPIPSTSIVGEWTATNVKGSTVSFTVSINPTTLQYRYCNSKSNGYTISGNRITITPGISTLMACINQTPTEYFVDQAFNSARTFKISNGILTFLDESGNTVITLRSGTLPVRLN